jgi:demethylmenaquinone methyltransferase/2-methoxy-6-polyprenyl-1,4-benzoquinol methylase
LKVKVGGDSGTISIYPLAVAATRDEMTSDSNEDRILEETREYYRQQAGEYADWAHPGRSESDSEPDASWYAEGKMLLEALEKSRLTGAVLEIAPGTGIWTEVLVKTAASITAVDSSQEMIARSRARLQGNPRVKFVNADFYKWSPDRTYDAVTFSFWISHVPRSKIDESFSKIADCLRSGGRLFFADQQVGALRNEAIDSPGGEIVTRKLDDGREFHIFKHFYTPEEITTCLVRNGIRSRISFTPIHFFYAEGSKS